MSRIAPADLRSLQDREQIESYYKARLGFVPNSAQLLAHRPAILRAVMELGSALQASDEAIDPVLRRMVAFMASRTRGCTFCQTHTAYGLRRSNVPDSKIAAIWDFETDDRFDDRERAALRLARDSALQPNAASDAHFEELRRFFSEGQIIEIVATCAYFAWLNIFNQTLATTLEPDPAEWVAATDAVEIDPVHLR